MNALIEEEKKEDRSCRVFWVEDLIPALTKAVEQQIQVLGEREPEGLM